MSVEQNIWSLRLPNGDVRSGTIEQLEEAFQAGHIDGNSYVLPPGARDWVTLGSINVAGHGRPPSVSPAAVAPVGPSNGLGSVRPSASPPPAASRPPPAWTPTSDDIWQVRLASGEIRSGTRQQLEEAFQAGVIDGSSLALPAGAREWMRLDGVLRRTEVAAVSASVSPPHTPADVSPPAPVALPQPTSVSPQYAPAAPVEERVAASPPQSPPQIAPQPPAQSPTQRTESDDEVCHAKVTRRQLEDALRAGYLDEGVLVLTFGATEWVRLGSLVDRGPVAPPPPSTPASVTRTGAWPPPAEGVGGPAEETPLSTPQSDPVTEVTTERVPEPTEDDNAVPTTPADETTPELRSLT